VPPRLIVITANDTFDPLWPALASACGVPLVVNGDSRGDDVTLTVTPAGVAVTDRHFGLPSDEDALRSWLRSRFRSTFAALERTKYRFGDIVGMSAVLASAARVVTDRTTPVLLTGETGTGKTLLARAIHYEGPRQAAPFVEVDCAQASAQALFGHARKPGLFHLAAGGTILLDAITDLSPPVRETLVRVIEENVFDVRTVAASRVPVSATWLGAEPITLPPLRARRDEIVPLTEHFVQRFAAEYGRPEAALSPERQVALTARDWPGNVRELRSVVERTLLLSATPAVTLAHFT
jgi:DNA-binding NtrC family response regulator